MKEKINDLPAVDIVKILEQRDHEQRLTVITEADSYQSALCRDASDILGDQSKYAERYNNLPAEKKVEDLIDRMTRVKLLK